MIEILCQFLEMSIDQIESDRHFQINLQNREQQFEKALQKQEQRFELALQNRKNEFDETLQQKERQWQKQLRQQDEKSQQREKTIELWIAFVGTALAVSGVSAGVINDPGKTIVQILSINPPSFCKSNDLVKFLCSNSFDVVFHILVGLIFAIPVAIFIGLIQKGSSPKS